MEGVRQQLILHPAIRGVEVKAVARIEDEERILFLLRQRGVEPRSRLVYFFDTPRLELFDAGVVLRARKIQDGPDDSTVKLRPVDPSCIPLDWIELPAFEVEIDRVGDRQVVSAKLSAHQARGEVDDVVAGRRHLRKLFSADQERLIAEFGPPDVGWERLRPMGPVTVLKWRFRSWRLRRRLVAERWRLPDGSDLVELSIKVPPMEADEAADAFVAFLTGFGLDVSGDQQTKTRAALSFFSADWHPGGGADR